MRKNLSRKALAGLGGLTLVAAGVTLAPLAFADPQPASPAADAPEYLPSDKLPNELGDKRAALREQALQGVLAGEYQTEQRGASTVVNMGGDVNRPGHNSRTQYVELGRETTDRIFVILVEFGDTPNPYPTAPNAQRTEGPLHNEIPEPDRSVDNATVWRGDYNQEYFQDLYFGEDESLKNYYEAQSSGRYSVDGEVTDWVKVNYTQGRYGTNSCGDNVCSTAKFLIRDAANQWYNDQIAAGRTPAEVAAELAEFDVWDRYDYDFDGDFNEPDGFIDHFQIVHAGGDEADGDPIYGGDALWSHRWYSNLAYGPTCNNPDLLCMTGTQVGNSGLWIGDYTLQPENGGRSVFYHEYGHDLELPDDYNNINGGDNNNEHWTLMAQSRLGAAGDEGIGERGGDLGAWNKAMLGWLNYEYVEYNQHTTIQLGPQEYNSPLPQAIVVGLPDQEIGIAVGAPYAGEHQWYSGHQNNNSTMILSRTVSVPSGDPTLRFQTRFDVEEGFDYAYITANGVPLEGTVDGVAKVDWDGTSGGWVPAEFDLSAFAGQSVQLKFYYVTDPAVGGNDPAQPDGVFLDEISVGDFADGAEAGTNGWDAIGWSIVTSESTGLYPHYYIAGYRSYTGYDEYLKTGPYYFGYGTQFPDKVDHYAYQEGLLISYYNTFYEGNDTFEHPGAGRNLYIDAHPQPFARSNGELWRARIQVYDAPFGTRTTDKVTLHHNGVAETFGGLPGNATFRDTDQYWFPELPNHGVKLPGYGVTIKVLNDSAGRLQVKVN